MTNSAWLRGAVLLRAVALPFAIATWIAIVILGLAEANAAKDSSAMRNESQCSPDSYVD